jgi:cobalt/nickel transport system permease protein/cobalt/nickel transport protein
VLLLALVLLVAGWLTGGGDLRAAYGADWSAIDWSAVGIMLAIVAVLAVVLIPLAWFLLPKAIRGVGTAYLAVAILTPIGLIAPGFAYGEGSTEDVQNELGYVPQGLQDLSGVFSAPFSGYNLPLPFFGADNAPLWQTAIGYEIAGLLGMLLLGGLLWLFGAVVMRRDSRELASGTG